MAESRKKKDAVSILHRRYVRGDTARETALEAERLNAKVARLLYDLRKQEGLSQTELAERVGTTQSVISRLEDADYEGHSLNMLQRIAAALGKAVIVDMVPPGQTGTGEVRHAFNLFIKQLRRANRLSVEQLSERTGISPADLDSLEKDIHFRPSPLVVHRLSKFYGVPERKMLVLAGAVKEVPPEVREMASRFAAHSESFGKLSQEEKEALDEFLRFLKFET